jgi:hypothetical protein
MTEEREWQWTIGILHGLGECMWEQSGSIIRHISRLIMDPQGRIGMMKSIIGGALIGCDEIDGSGMVVFSVGATAEQAKNAKSLWSNIVPVNGASRFKLEK